MRGKNCVTTFRGDMKEVATCVAFFHLKGLRPQTLSETLRLVVGGFTDLLHKKHPDLVFETTEQALRYLEEEGLFDPTCPQRGRASLVQDLSIEDMEDKTQSARISLKARTLPRKLVAEVEAALSDEQLKVERREVDPQDLEHQKSELLKRPAWVKDEK